MPLPNPSFEPQTHRWRPGAVAPSREVPSQICAVLGQTQPFFAQNSPSKGSKQPNEGKWLLTSRAACLSRDQGTFGALSLRDISEKRPKKAPKSPKICAMCISTPKPRTGRILGYVAQKRIPRAPSPPAIPHFLWFPSLRIAQRDT